MRKYGLFIFSFILTGCASIFGHKSQMVTVNSIPSGAEVFINDEYIGLSPVSIQLRRKISKSTGKLKKSKHLDEDSIEERQNLIQKNSYHVSIIKKNYKSIEYDIRPTKNIQTSGNKYYCIIDNGLAVITLGISYIINEQTKSCYGFEKIYSFDLKSANLINNKTYNISKPAFSNLEIPDNNANNDKRSIIMGGGL